MTLRDIPNLWSARFGLARVPLFGEGDAPGGVDHAVLLDGGYGTFALSIWEDELWREAETASWVWSGNTSNAQLVDNLSETASEPLLVFPLDQHLQAIAYDLELPAPARQMALFPVMEVGR